MTDADKLARYDDLANLVEELHDECMALRQQLADAQENIDNLHVEVADLRQQLAAALAACKQKNVKLHMLLMPVPHEGETPLSICKAVSALAEEALAIQPDDSALRAWIGEPVAFVVEDGDDREYNTIDEFSRGRTGGTKLRTERDGMSDCFAAFIGLALAALLFVTGYITGRLEK